MKLKYDEIFEAIQFVSDGEEYNNQAYVEKSNGKIHYHNGYEQLPQDKKLPKNIHSNLFIEIPTLKDLDLKHTLIFEFALEILPDYYDQIREIFSRRGAYRNFRELLIRIDALDKWYDFENKSTREKIKKWCIENDIQCLK